MYKIKKCASCGHNSFKLLVDKHPSLCCDNCGQVYLHTVFTRLPDDLEASRNIKISILKDAKDITSSLVIIN